MWMIEKELELSTQKEGCNFVTVSCKRSGKTGHFGSVIDFIPF